MSGRSARTIRNFSLELWQDLVLHGIRKSTFQHLTVNWNFNVLEMALKTLHFVQGLSRTPLSFLPRYLTTRFSKNSLQNKHISIIENLKIPKPRFTNKCPEKLLAHFFLKAQGGLLFLNNSEKTTGDQRGSGNDPVKITKTARATEYRKMGWENVGAC